MRITTVRLAVISALAAQSAVMSLAARAAESTSLEEITVTATRVALTEHQAPWVLYGQASRAISTG